MSTIDGEIADAAAERAAEPVPLEPEPKSGELGACADRDAWLDSRLTAGCHAACPIAAPAMLPAATRAAARRKVCCLRFWGLGAVPYGGGGYAAVECWAG